MEEDESYVTEKIWNLALEIVYLLAGEVGTFGSHESVSVSPPLSLTPKRRTMKKILEITNMITELLTGEELEEVDEDAGTQDEEEARNYYMTATVKDQPLPPTPDGFSTRIIPERSPRPLYSQDSTQEVTPHHYQAETGKAELAIEKSHHTEDCNDLHRNIKVELSSPWVTPERSPLGDDGHGASAEDTGVKIDGLCEKEENSPVLGATSQYVLKSKMTHPDILDCKTEKDDIIEDSAAGNLITTDLHPECLKAERECFSNDSYSVHHTAHEGEVISHQSNLTGEKPYSCATCGKCYSHKSDLLKHERAHLAKKTCSCSFYHTTTLTRHMGVHTVEKTCSCSECGNCFSHKSHPNTHGIIHTGEKPYSCSECEKSFSDKYHLLRHERTHTGEKPYFCSKCGKGFSRKSHVIRHEKIHTGEKPHSCSECWKRFSQKSDLFRHKRVHLTKKPYSCSECGKCFSSESHCIRHERIHRREKPYSCSECGKCFSYKSHFIKHETMHRGEQP